MKKIKIVRVTTIPLAFEKLLENQLSFVKSFYDVIAVSSDEKKLKKFAKSQGVKWYSIEMTRKITPIIDLISLFKMYFFIRREKPDIIHTHTPKAGVIGMFAAYIANVPIRLHTVAGLPLLETTGIKRIILNFVEKLTYKFSTKIYPNSYGLKEIILKNNFTVKNKLKIIGNGSSNGIDTNYFNPDLISKEQNQILRSNLKIQKTDFVFIFIGRIVGDKGINELVEAFNLFSKETSKTKLLLVGNFEDELDPISKSSKNIISNNDKIILAGYQNDVRPYFSISDVLIFPSYREGLPNVVLQAGAMGLPSIVSNINGCNEIIENNTNGLVIKVKCIDAIYDAMIKITSDKILFNKLRLNSRDSIKIKYEREALWGMLLNEYEDLIKVITNEK